MDPSGSLPKLTGLLRFSFLIGSLLSVYMLRLEPRYAC